MFILKSFTCRGALLEVQNGTQQDLYKMSILGGKKIVYMLKQDLNKMLDIVKFGGQKDGPDVEKSGAKPRCIPVLIIKEGVPQALIQRHIRIHNDSDNRSKQILLTVNFQNHGINSKVPPNQIL